MYTVLKPVRLRIVREEHGLSRQALSVRANVSPAIIGKIESGRYIPYDGELERIASVLGVDDPADLMRPIGDGDE